MGLLERTASKVKSSVATNKSSLNEMKEVNNLQNQIKAERNKVNEMYTTIGKEYYRWQFEGDESHKKNCDDLVADINQSRKLIENLEAQIGDIREAGKEERSTIKAETDAKLEEIQAADEEARAEKERLRKEREDPF